MQKLWHMTYESIVRFAIDAGIEDEAGLTAKLSEAGWDYETTVTAREHFADYRAARAEAEKIKQAAVTFLAAFDADTADQHADERARRKAFAARLFGPEAKPETRALAPYCFLAYDGRLDKLDATLLRHIVLNRGRKSR